MSIMHKKYLFVLLVICVLLSGCAGNNDEHLIFGDLSEANHVIISLYPNANPACASIAKNCTQAEDVEMIITAIKDVRGKEIPETIYGGEYIYISIYRDESNIYKIYIYSNAKLIINGKTYSCTKLHDFNELYDSLKANEEVMFLDY